MVTLQNLTRLLDKTKWWLVTSASASVATYALLALASSTTTATGYQAGSYLDVQGVVVAPSTSPTLGSTFAISGNDEVQFTSYFNSKIGVAPNTTPLAPVDSDAVMTLPLNFSWINTANTGYFKGPPNTVPRWSLDGSTWQTTEPANGTVVQKVGWTQKPFVLVNGGGGGGTTNFIDASGYHAIRYGGNIYMIETIFSNGQPEDGMYLRCRVAATNAICPGFGAPAGTNNQGQPAFGDGRAISPTMGNNLMPASSSAPGTEYVTQVRAVEHLDNATGNLFTYLIDPNVSGGYSYPLAKILCVNLNTRTSCMDEVRANPSENETGGNPRYLLSPLGSVGDQYYALSHYTGKMYCFNTTTKAICPGSPFIPVPSDPTALKLMPGAVSVGALVMAGKLFYATFSAAQTSPTAPQNGLRCWDPTTNTECSGWVGGFSTYPTSQATQIVGVLNPDGTDKGVCQSFGPGNCYLINGTPFGPNNATPGSFGQFMSQFNGTGGTLEYGRYGTRIYTSVAPTAGSSGVVQCWDFATSAFCLPTPGFPVTPNPTPNIQTIRADPANPPCMWAGGPGGGASFDAITGGPCNGGAGWTSNIDMDLGNYFQCDATRAQVSGWSKIRISPNVAWSGTGITSIKVTLKDWTGAQLPAALNPVRNFSSGSYELDISDISYATYPKLKIKVEVTGGTGLSGLSDTGIDITWNGDPAQTCFKVKAPANIGDACVTPGVLSTSLTLSNKPFHLSGAAATPYTEVLTTGTSFATGSLSGFGPTTISTTLRENTTSGNADRTKILQTRFNLLNQSGDLNVYTLDAGSTIASTPAAIASANTPAAASRLIYTATPPSSTTGWLTTTFVWTNLNPLQKRAMRTNLSGVLDSLGDDRLSYLRGVHTKEIGNTGGVFRNRGTRVLGPAINSSPALLPRSPRAGYSELNYPGYFAFRQGLTTQPRSADIAFYGGNDGMLHAYKITDSGSAVSMSEAFSFIPNMMLRQASRYSDTTPAQFGQNPYFVDSTPMIRDANLASATSPSWKSVLVNTLGRGGRGIFALDVTRADLAGNGFTPSVLWEYTNETHADLKDLGYIIGSPPAHDVAGAAQIVRLGKNAKRWAVLVGNGVNSNQGTNPSTSGTGRPVLYAFYLDGQAPKWHRFDAYAGSDAALNALYNTNNGLSTPRPVDVDGDGVTDLVYAGDIKGNLWRFKIDTLDPSNATNPSNVSKHLFSAQSNQRIVSAPEVKPFNGNGNCPSAAGPWCWMVTFGTTADVNIHPLQAKTDLNGSPYQALYGIWDKNGAAVDMTVADLQAQAFGASTTTNGRSVSSLMVDYTTKKGWYLPLTMGEHVLANPALQSNGGVLYSSTSCLPPPLASYLTQLNPYTGSGVTGVFGGNASSLLILGASFETPLVLRPASLNSTTENVVLSGGNLGSSPSTQTKSTSSMLGRSAWREVYGAAQ